MRAGEPTLPNMRLTLLFSLILSGSSLPACAQANWNTLKALPAHTKVHVNGDKMSRACSLDAVTDETLVCSKGRMLSTAHYTFTREEVRTVKLSHYARSTLGGMAIGAGVGAALGFAMTGKDSFLPTGETRGLTTLAGAGLGGLALGPVDAFRGGTVYRRAGR